MSSRPKIVIAAQGSLGDTLPFDAIANTLRAQGAQVINVRWSKRFTDPFCRSEFSNPAIPRMEERLLERMILMPLAADVSRLKKYTQGAAAIVTNGFCVAARHMGLPVIVAEVSPAYAVPAQQILSAEFIRRHAHALALPDELLLTLKLYPACLGRTAAHTTGPCWHYPSTQTLDPQSLRFVRQAKRLALVTFGSWVAPIHKQPLYNRLLPDLLATGHEVVVLDSDAAISVPSHPRLLKLPYFPLPTLLPLTHLAITHAGIGIAVQLLRYGTPRISYPFCADQFYNAEKLNELTAPIKIENAAELAAQTILQTVS